MQRPLRVSMDELLIDGRSLAMVAPHGKRLELLRAMGFHSAMKKLLVTVLTITTSLVRHPL